MTPPPVDIQWQAPAECPTQASVVAAIERLLGRRLAELAGYDLHAHGKVEKSEDGKWRLSALLALGERRESDELLADKCRSLADAMALKVALAIDPLAVVDSVEPTPAASVSTPATPSPAVPVAPGRADRLHAGLRLVGSVALGPLPGATPGVGLYGSLQWPHFRFELGGLAFWDGIARYPALSGVGADLQLFAGAARGCVTPGSGRFLFPICVGAELGALRGQGFGTAQTASTWGLWGGVGIGPAVQFQASRTLSLWVEADAGATLLKPEFHMRNLDSLYSPAAGSSRASAGLEVKF